LSATTRLSKRTTSRTMLDPPPPDPLLARIDDAIAERLAMLGGDNDEEALRLEGSFIDFVESAWPSIDPAVFQIKSRRTAF
jgi:hypothetical protein